jgi:membrane-associated phospholipid phosphatase
VVPSPLVAICLAYVVLAGGVVALAPSLRHLHGRAAWLLPAFALSLLMVRVLPWVSSPRRLRFAEDAVFALWMGTVYVLGCEISLGLAGPATLDAWLSGIDVGLFGVPAAVAFERALPGPVWRELLHLAYFCYYLMIPVAIIAWYSRKREAEAVDEMNVTPGFRIALAFLGSLVLYLWLPTHGPLDHHVELFPSGGPFTWLVTESYALAPAHAGGAFPSSHVAVGLVCVIIAARASQPLGAALAVVFTLLCIATVFCSFHYLLDVPAGLALGGAATVLADASSRLGHHLRQRSLRPHTA